MRPSDHSASVLDRAALLADPAESFIEQPLNLSPIYRQAIEAELPAATTAVGAEPELRSSLRSFNIIARDNGAGLSQDIQLLTRALSDCLPSARINLTRLGHHGRLEQRLLRMLARLRQLLGNLASKRAWHARYDANLMLESIRGKQLRSAGRNLLVPNPEWFEAGQAAALADIDLVLSKTLHAVSLFAALGVPVRYVGFTSADHWRPQLPRKAAFLHIAGASPHKGSLPLMHLWARHPEWPTLTVVWRRNDQNLPANWPENIVLLRERLDEETLIELQNRHAFHLCPSETEGYGHYIGEALSVGAVVLTLDAAPMNELVTPERGVLIPAEPIGSQGLATLYGFSDQAMCAGIEACLAMPAEQRGQLGRQARLWFEHNRDDFPQRLQRALRDVSPG